MSEIILWSLLAFFGAFGIVEFIRFAYTDWVSSEKYYHVVVCADKFEEDLEIAVRNTMLSTEISSLILVTDSESLEQNDVYKKLLKKYGYIKLMKTDEYIEYLRSRDC